MDISDVAIDTAVRLSRATGLAAAFHRADVYTWLEQSARSAPPFDVAFSSYGALMWLSNVEAWAQGVARVLASDGRLVVIDYHPFALLFDPKGVRDANYFAGGRPRSSSNGLMDYVGEAGPADAPWGFLEGVRGFVNPHRSHEFFWGVGEVLPPSSPPGSGSRPSWSTRTPMAAPSSRT